MLQTADDILAIIRQDTWMMEILQTVKQLNLADWWIGAGFVRSKVWDYLHHYQKPTPLDDIDVIYFDKAAQTKQKEKEMEYILLKKFPLVSWQVKNQARMHEKHKDTPYLSSIDALSHWVETATCIAVTLTEKNELRLAAPYGITDLLQMKIRPTPYFQNHHAVFEKRYKEKKWLSQWPKLQIILPETC